MKLPSLKVYRKLITRKPRQSNPMNTNYTIFEKPLDKKEAINLLETLATDLRQSKEKINRAIVWGRDIQKLNWIDIAKALGYKSHSNVIEKYNKLKGGEQHEQY